jgi:hypothetical protein
MRLLRRGARSGRARRRSPLPRQTSPQQRGGVRGWARVAGLSRGEGGGQRGTGRGGAPPSRRRAGRTRHGPTRGGRMGWFR